MTARIRERLDPQEKQDGAEAAGEAGQIEIGRPVGKPQEVQATPTAEVIPVPLPAQTEEKSEDSKPGTPPDSASGGVIPEMDRERKHSGLVTRGRQQQGDAAQLRLF